MVLAPEFINHCAIWAPFYHAKQQAVGAAESIVEFLNIDVSQVQSGSQNLPEMQGVEIVARDLGVFSPEGKCLVGPLTFTLNSQQTTALVGPSGAGQNQFDQCHSGFHALPRQPCINGIELSELDHAHWRKQISWWDKPVVGAWHHS